ncbi:hypothetical protein [Herbaspirillum camelliae]|uniref:hypothetical protein n=1 Tax=Herbaspirillum camelliae TaxID=1892903 RepID=UPI00094A0614|nr:hypothetical protein [Herbaspirillum camelliae]
MSKPDKAELDRIRRELAEVYHEAAWKAAALITRASVVRDGLDQPLEPDEWESLRLILNRLTSAARHAEQVLRHIRRPFGPDRCCTGEAGLEPEDLPAALRSQDKGVA